MSAQAETMEWESNSGPKTIAPHIKCESCGARYDQHYFRHPFRAPLTTQQKLQAARKEAAEAAEKVKALEQELKNANA